MKRIAEFILKKYKIFREKKIKSKLGKCGINNNIFHPILASKPQNIFLDDYTLIQPYCKFIIYSGKFYLKKWSSLSCNCTIVTGNHRPTVGINQRLLGRLHINDKESDIIVEEDCWVGANVTLLSGTYIGRGSVVGACSLVNKKFPPYAVLVGIPAKIIASKFTIDEIIDHEMKLYPPKDRLSKQYLEELFKTYYKDKPSIGTKNIPNDFLEKINNIDSMQYSI